LATVASIALSERVCAWAAALGGCAVVVCLLGVWADPVRAPHEHEHDHGPGAPVQYFRPPPSAPAVAAASPAPALVALPTPVVEAPLAEVTPVVPVTAAPALVSLVSPAVAPPHATLKPIASPVAPHLRPLSHSRRICRATSRNRPIRAGPGSRDYKVTCSSSLKYLQRVRPSASSSANPAARRLWTTMRSCGSASAGPGPRARRAAS